MQVVEIAPTKYKAIDSSGNIYCISADSRGQAMDLYNSNFSEESKLIGRKSSIFNGFKSLAKSELEATDWKITRHKEQLELGITTSLDNTQYSSLLAERQAIRDKSNDLEAQVNAAETIEELNGINWQ